MKKQLLFSAMMLIGLTSIEATNANFAPQGDDFTSRARYRYVEPIIFMEQAVEFLIFPDGSFDFNANFRNPTNNNRKVQSNERKKSRRSSVNTDQGRSGTVNNRYYGKTKVNGLIIERDYNGMVRRIGNVFVEYDKHYRIKRVGSIKMNYDNGKLSKVGDLKVKYNRWDEIANVRGTVNAANRNYGSHYTTAQSRPIYRDFANQEDYYYYKQGAAVKNR